MKRISVIAALLIMVFVLGLGYLLEFWTLGLFDK